MQPKVASAKAIALFDEYHREIANPVALVLQAAKGIRIHFFDAFLKIANLQKNQLAAFIHATPRTIDNYRQKNGVFGRVESEQLLQLLALYKKGEEIFGDTHAFGVWLHTEAIGLGNIQPFDLLYTQGGINLVMEELLRIEFGALA
jgi:putative toxin-antitoxin system antitoxin component (TIGR02293 family)